MFRNNFLNCLIIGRASAICEASRTNGVVYYSNIQRQEHCKILKKMVSPTKKKNTNPC